MRANTGLAARTPPLPPPPPDVAPDPIAPAASAAAGSSSACRATATDWAYVAMRLSPSALVALSQLSPVSGMVGLRASTDAGRRAVSGVGECAASVDVRKSCQGLAVVC